MVRVRSSNGRSFHREGPTTESAWRCLVVKRGRGTRTSPLVAERSSRRTATSETGWHHYRELMATKIQVENQGHLVPAPDLSLFIVCCKVTDSAGLYLASINASQYLPGLPRLSAGPFGVCCVYRVKLARASAIKTIIIWQDNFSLSLLVSLASCSDRWSSRSTGSTVSINYLFPDLGCYVVQLVAPVANRLPVSFCQSD